MIKKEFKVNTDYDQSLDVYTITVDEEFEFGKSLEIEDGVILDFPKALKDYLNTTKITEAENKKVDSTLVYNELVKDYSKLLQYTKEIKKSKPPKRPMPNICRTPCTAKSGKM